jgi:VWFA-related protein
MRPGATKATLAVLVGAGTVVAAQEPARFEIGAAWAGAATASAAPAVPPDLVPILERAGRYVLDYEQAFRDIAAEETYTQWTGPRLKTASTGPALLCTPAGCQRTTRADVVWVHLGGEVPWGTFRDVFEVDGQRVHEPEGRLESLFAASSPASGMRRVQAILNESARYNIGPAVRNINFPTLALLFLHPRNQHRFAWKRGGTRRFGGREGVEVDFEEIVRPTLVDEDGRADLPAKGRFWVDPARGTVLRSETTFRFEAGRARASVATLYRPEPKLTMWVPAEMREEYEDLSGPPVFGSPSRATARYSNFRKFTATVESVTARLPGEPAEATGQTSPAGAAEAPGRPSPGKPGEASERPPAVQAEPPPERPPAEATSAGQPPAAPPTFPSAVQLITVDAVVLDGHGQPVPGLTKDDFVVKEDGRPQDVVSFQAFDVGPAREEPEAVAPGVVTRNEPGPRDAGRGFAIVVDDLGLAPERTTVVQDAVKQFLERSVRDGDLVTLATTSGNAWWSARVPEGREDLLAVLARAHGRFSEASVLDYMSDYEAFWIADHESSGLSYSPSSITARVVARWEATGVCPKPVMGSQPIRCPALVRARATQLDGLRRNRLLSRLACVRRGLEALATIRGRKSLLLLSEGFLDDPGSDARAVEALSREANTAIYFVDARGLEALPGGFGSAAQVGPPTSGRERFEAATLESAGAVALADDTGGFAVRNTNDLAGGLGRIGAESRVFYLLGFYPPEGKAQGEWRNLRVEVKRSGLTVRARRGYTIRSEMNAAAAAKAGKEKGKAAALDPAVARALDSPRALSGIPLRAIVYVLEPRPKDTVHVLVASEIDAGAVVSEAHGPRRLEVEVAAMLRDSGGGFRHDDTVSVSAPKGDEPRWRAFVRAFELPAGVAQVRVVVRDPATGAIGSLVQRVEVPAPGEFRLSTPILTDRIVPAENRGDRPRPAIAAHRVFPEGGGLYCEYEVFGAGRPGGAPPRVAAAFQIRSSDGTVVRESPPTPIAPDANGRVVRTVGASLQGLPPGPYELVIDVRDETTGERIVRREAFTLAPQEKP